ncbi:hypothetical protein UCDDA912_g08163 [Diaporthe ampelina]|uniref:Uncharacterized protein n=1 Tax=Diaporthe ampelina TaxID=1214573 RepID=A0A0G2FCI1_9PEZI|nr:hypothetical protein UCDDA912_g08163 [Diaporthe ampelina]
MAFVDDHIVKLCANLDILPGPGGTLGIESLSFVFPLLLCLAVEGPDYVKKEKNMVKSFQTGNTTTTQDMPSPGHLLVAPLISDGFPALATAAYLLAAELRRILAVDSIAGVLEYLG